MTTLTGTDKQIAWATDIRNRIAADVAALLAKIKCPAETAAAITAEIVSHTEARWYIDRREYDARELALDTDAFRAAKAAATK